MSPANEAWKRAQDLAFSHISFSNNSGEAIENAIIIMNATGEEDGVGSEYTTIWRRDSGNKGSTGTRGT